MNYVTETACARRLDVAYLSSCVTSLLQARSYEATGEQFPPNSCVAPPTLVIHTSFVIVLYVRRIIIFESVSHLVTVIGVYMYSTIF